MQLKYESVILLATRKGHRRGRMACAAIGVHNIKVNKHRHTRIYSDIHVVIKCLLILVYPYRHVHKWFTCIYVCMYCVCVYACIYTHVCEKCMRLFFPNT
jgi:hypothetical protein